jgi:site-specific DNA recombinase
MASSRGARGRSPSSHLVGHILPFAEDFVKLWHTKFMRLLDPPDEGPYERDCVIYLRKSQGKTGIPRQRRENEARAKRLRWRIVAEFEDTDTTAFMHALAEKRVVRDDYQALLTMLREDTRSEPLGVLAYSSDRLHRDTEEASRFIRICAKGKHPVETAVSGGFDLTTAAGRGRLKQDAAAAEREVDVTSERWQRMKADMARQGMWLGGPVPFGWRPVRPADDEPRVLVLKEDEAEAIEWAFQGVLRGDTSLEMIAREWNRRGLRRRGKGGLWTGQLVGRTLRRPRNAAIMEHLGQIIHTELADGKAAWPPIVSEEMWRAVAGILAAPERNNGPGPKPRWLGSGLFLCGAVLNEAGDLCLAPLAVGNSAWQKRPDGTMGCVPAYRCFSDKKSRRWPHVARRSTTLDAYVDATLRARLKRPDVRSHLAQQEPPDLSGKRAELRAEWARLREWEAVAKTPGASPSLVIAGEMATRQRIEDLKGALAAAVTSPLLAELVEADDIDALFDSKRDNLEWRRSILRMFVTVVVKESPKGHVKGWRPGDLSFRTEAIRFDWKPLGGVAPPE